MINDFRYLSHEIISYMASTAINHDNPHGSSVISFSACMQRISNVDSDTHNTKPFKFQMILLKIWHRKRQKETLYKNKNYTL